MTSVRASAVSSSGGVSHASSVSSHTAPHAPHGAVSVQSGTSYPSKGAVSVSSGSSANFFQPPPRHVSGRGHVVLGREPSSTSHCCCSIG